jgi:hypothetical protein
MRKVLMAASTVLSACCHIENIFSCYGAVSLTDNFKPVIVDEYSTPIPIQAPVTTVLSHSRDPP